MRKLVPRSRQPMTTGEVARLFRVRPATVQRWAREGKLPYFRTPYGHRRFRRDDVGKFLDNENRGKGRT